MHITLSIRKTIEVDDELFKNATQEEYRETKEALEKMGEIYRGLFVNLDDVFIRMYDNGQIFLEIKSEDIEVDDGFRDVDHKTGKLI